MDNFSWKSEKIFNEKKIDQIMDNFSMNPVTAISVITIVFIMDNNNGLSFD